MFDMKAKEIIRKILFVLFGPFILFIDNLSNVDEDLSSAMSDWFSFLFVSMFYYGIPVFLIWGLVCHTTPTLIVLGFIAGLVLFIVGIPWMLWKIVKMLVRYFDEKKSTNVLDKASGK